MPANRANLSVALKPANGFAAGSAKKKKQRTCAKNKRHCRQYLQLHSEYRSTYTWHEYTGPHQEHTVVRRAPQPPPTSTKQASAKLQSAKSTEDENSEGPTLEPPLPRRKKCPELAYKTHEFITAADGSGIDAVDSNVVADNAKEITATSALPPSQLSKAISRISTEYRLQFAWPKRPQLTNGEAVPVAPAGGPGGTAGPPRKSLSMGALKQGMAPSGPAPVHKKRPGDVDHKRDGVQASELEPLVGGTGTDTMDGVVLEGDEREEDLDLKVAFRSVTKEEKEKENTRKVAPVPSASMPPAGRPSSVQARPIHTMTQEEVKADTDRAIARARKDFLIRHHLDRTTGVAGDGALLPSPTREKLEPVIPRKREESKESREDSQPRTKSSPKNSPRTGRSQSLGPSVAERRSPKRQPVRAPSVTKDAKDKDKEPKDKEKESREKSAEPERHPRPMTAEPQINGDTTGGDSSVASTPPSQTATAIPGSTGVATAASPWVDDEPVVKSPPEPTRVKSPEQMIMRSPEPVNWTVPLDTGKTFTVTQNVREEPLTRPHSEAKTWAPSGVPSAPQSAPPELAAQHKSQHSQHSGYKSPESESISLGSFSGLNGHKDLDSERDSPLPTNVQGTPTPTRSDKALTETAEETKEQSLDPAIKPVAGTNLRCLEDPVFEFDKKRETVLPPEAGVDAGQGAAGASPGGVGGTTAGGYHVLEAPSVGPGSGPRSAASDVLEKARNRFDKFWGKGGSEN
ncbi:proteoglycan 4 isoform X3 [Orussus abietinus]|uniref:proteoglycan 4 isoform X3 n=1 Tax=Orussus abietinus TaxID=222816 RepID=UPI000C716066|nr:proteoglycan 4 isoform X3 [Orussus abietinus]